MTLNNVVFPAPLGPMSAVTAAASAVRLTSLRAATPPTCTAMSGVCSSRTTLLQAGNARLGTHGARGGRSEGGAFGAGDGIPEPLTHHGDDAFGAGEKD